MPDDLVERYWELQSLFAKIRHPGPPPYSAIAMQKWTDAVAALQVACDPKTLAALTARLAALEQATPDEVVEMIADAMERETAAINAERTEGHEMPRMYRVEKTRMARAVISAIAAPLRAQGAVVERERCARICDDYKRDGLNPREYANETADELAARIRAGVLRRADQVGRF